MRAVAERRKSQQQHTISDTQNASGERCNFGDRFLSKAACFGSSSLTPGATSGGATLLLFLRRSRHLAYPQPRARRAANLNTQIRMKLASLIPSSRAQSGVCALPLHRTVRRAGDRRHVCEATARQRDNTPDRITASRMTS
jgi:hypothetical protein